MLRRSLIAAQALTRCTHPRVFIGLGSNIGDRAGNLDRALKKISSYAEVVTTGFLYETTPMYVKSQPSFYNTVAEIRTSLQPNELLKELKRTEKELGRSRTYQRYSPRTIDLDILMYGGRELSISDTSFPLDIPHTRLKERQFVLRPLADIAPTLEIPGVGLVCDILREASEKDNHRCESQGVCRVTPLRNGRQLIWGHRTLLMGIINVTPDSFSDGGKHIPVSQAIEQARRFLDADFDVLDIGGQSTRPGACDVDEDTEMSRVLPVVRALSKEFPAATLSIDTFRGVTAEAALDEGAVIVNDVSAGMWCDRMLPTLVRKGAPWIAMHTRGRPSNMMKLANYKDVTSQAGSELSEQIERALNKGVKRWRIITDGGIGFAKNATHNWELLHNWADFKQQGGSYPTLLGLSRKGFLRQTCHKDSLPVERDWATAGALGATVATRAVDMVRVHEASLGDAIRAADKVVRHGFVP